MSNKRQRDYAREQLNYSAFIDERKTHVTEEQKQAASFDKYLLTIATGTFGVTVTFIKDITGGAVAASTKWMIVWAWTLLAATIVLVLASFMTTLKASREQIAINREYFITNQGEGSPDKNPWNRVTGIVNATSSASFVAALVLLFLFVSVNLRVTP